MTARFQAAKDSPLSIHETAGDRRRRLQREAEIIAQAHAEIDAGFGIEDRDMEVWLEQLGHDQDAPLPAPGDTITRL